MPSNLADLYNYVDTYLDGGIVERHLMDRWSQGACREIVDFERWPDQYVQQVLAIDKNGLAVGKGQLGNDLVHGSGTPNHGKIPMATITLCTHSSRGQLDLISYEQALDYWINRPVGSIPSKYSLQGSPKGLFLRVYPAPTATNDAAKKTSVNVYGVRDTSEYNLFPDEVPFIGAPGSHTFPMGEAFFGMVCEWVLAEALDHLGQEGGAERKDRFYTALDQYRRAQVPLSDATYRIGGGTATDPLPGVDITVNPS